MPSFEKQKLKLCAHVFQPICAPVPVTDDLHLMLAYFLYYSISHKFYIFP